MLLLLVTHGRALGCEGGPRHRNFMPEPLFHRLIALQRRKIGVSATEWKFWCAFWLFEALVGFSRLHRTGHYVRDPSMDRFNALKTFTNQNASSIEPKSGMEHFQSLNFSFCRVLAEILD